MLESAAVSEVEHRTSDGAWCQEAPTERGVDGEEGSIEAAAERADRMEWTNELHRLRVRQY